MTLAHIKRLFRKISRRLYGKGLTAARSTSDKDYSFYSGERQVGATLNEIRVDHTARYNIVLKDIFNEDDLIKNGFGLDIFCGNGYGTQMLSKIPNCCVWGIDGSQEAAVHAESHFGSSNNFFTQKIFPFVLPASLADFVVCMESIEHIEDHEGFVKMLFAALRPGGIFYVSAPNEAVMPFSKSAFPFHFRHYNVNEIEHIAKNNNTNVDRFWCQDVYEMAGDTISHTLNDDIRIREGTNGQWLIAKMRKTGSS